MLIDNEKLKIKGGDGGNGVVNFLPEKGPGGGDGGKGGDIVGVGVNDITILQKRKHKKSFTAENGKNGAKQKRMGRSGEDLEIQFPVGSVIKNIYTGEVVEILEEDQKEILAVGGKGGLGNVHFKSSRNTTPKIATKGQIGQEYEMAIELKLIAEYGLVGLPNAGKSTLLNTLTNAHSKIGSYAFTTLEPSLGVLDGRVIADIPGLIEGASDGKGLGHKFLRHIQRTKKIIHLISLENENPLEVYNTIRGELKKFDAELIEKEEIVVLTKIDLVDDEIVKKAKKDLSSVTKEVFSISCRDKDTVGDLVKRILK